ncbi:MAG: winged helix-turn-helix domain-containing protein [Bacillati bacterium ANGP1]|uniref:Winged helix-turn-helix domain-containing protein n=1 Tax=Candidatus Segetimicrobium genomatis TaxID=2569760 RepID=A0A537IZK3_9BACT|nr:MAG: winged helix-turn-helix domain-containing protein [Terrabacteria group bacterium ANGP1]
MRRACFRSRNYPIFEHKRRQIRRRLRTDFERIRPAARAVLARLEREGPLPARAFASEQRVHGWWDIKGPRTKVTSHALNLLAYVGQVMVIRREGLERHFDLPERAVPALWLRRAREMDADEADQALSLKYMRAHRIFDLGDGTFGWRKIPAPQRRTIVERLIRAGTVIPLQIDGVRGSYYMLAEDEGRLRRHERRALQAQQTMDAPVRFLAPLDNLLWRRERVRDLFDFDYTWEVYVPPARRTYGYYTMPILAGDRFIGRFDPRLDRESGRLDINLLYLERGVRATSRLRTMLEDALHAFARFHGASELRIVRSRPVRLLS